MKNIIDQLSQDLARAEYSESTRKKYRKVAESLQAFFGKSIMSITRDELREFVQATMDQCCSVSQKQQNLCALLFLYRRTLGKPEFVSFIKLPRKHSKLPEVLSKQEVHALLNAIQSPRYQTIAMVMYGTGLRISEALVLTVDDIDSARGVIGVLHGKGNKAREVKLSETLYQWLRQYWRREQPPLPYLFANKKGKLPQKATLGRAFALAAKRAWIKKPVTPHVLRHYVPFRTMSCGFAAV